MGGEEVAGFKSGSVDGIRTVRAIVLDTRAQVTADGTGHGFGGVVAPMVSRQRAMAPGASSAITTIFPELMKAVSSSKNTFPRCTA